MPTLARGLPPGHCPAYSGRSHFDPGPAALYVSLPCVIQSPNRSPDPPHFPSLIPACDDVSQFPIDSFSRTQNEPSAFYSYQPNISRTR